MTKMRITPKHVLQTVLVLAVLMAVGGPAAVLAADDIAAAPSCRHCGMDREKFAHARMVVVYDDGAKLGTCGLHCAALDMAVSIDKAPVSIQVGDHDTRQLIDAETAAWVIGGDQMGVMTKRAKWAFAEPAAAQAFVDAHGGEMAGFEEALQAAYEDMYTDTKMIREKRKMMRMKKQQNAQ